MSGMPDSDEDHIIRRALNLPGAPHQLAKYNRGVYEVSAERPADAGPEWSTGPGRLATCRDVAKQLAFEMMRMDNYLEDADTGRLIRMVLHTEQGALLSAAVTPRNYILGMVFGSATQVPPVPLPDVELVREADKVVSDLAETLRDELGLPPANLGGWITAQPTVASPAPAAGRSPGNARSEVYFWDTGESPYAEKLRDLLDPDELHYLAHVRDGRLLVETDLLEHPEAARHRSPFSPPSGPRAFYRRMATDLSTLRNQFSQLTRQVMRGRLLRAVLDVEQGAVYYYRLNATEFLVGVTLNQKKVSQSDQKLATLAAAARRG
ncbi:MAG: hypothetical protein ABIS86_09760 [Streptosporangiaceae bacterium]